MWRLLVPLVPAILLAGCGSNPADGVIRVETMVTDGEAVYAVLTKADIGGLVTKFDTDGETVWEQPIGSSRAGGHLHGGHLWVVESDPPGRDLPLAAPDFLLKIDTETGEVVRSAVIAAGSGEPSLVIDGKLWLFNSWSTGIEIVDLDTLLVDEKIDLGDAGAPESVAGTWETARSPVRIGDHLYFVAEWPRTIVKYSIARRQIENLHVDDNLGIRLPLEIHDGQLWIPDVKSSSYDESGWFAHRMNLETFTIAATMPFLESPMWSLKTDRWVLDQAVVSREEGFALIDKIDQIDRKTGTVIRTFEGTRPQFVLGGHLWLAHLERVEID